MPEVTLEALTQRVSLWQGRLHVLGISHWKIKVLIVPEFDGEDQPGARASTENSYDSATIEFLESDLAEFDDLDVVIVHELLHVAWRDHDEALKMVEGYLPRQTALVDFRDRMEHESEKLVERLARLIVELHS